MRTWTIFSLAVCLLLPGWSEASTSEDQNGSNDFIITNANVITAPNEPLISNATITMRNGKIVGISTRSTNAPKENTLVIDVHGKFVSAGFWNSHVHLTDPDLYANAGSIVQAMLLQYGFTSMVDTGADPRVITRIVEAISAGQYPGPRIVISGGSLVYKDGTPSYLPGLKLPGVYSTEQARSLTQSILASGVDGIKIFSGSFQTMDKTIWIPRDIVRAITETAHEQGAYVIAHPTDRVGLENAVYGGVDVLAHTAPPAGDFGPELLAEMIRRNVALVPTLKLWNWELRRSGVPDKEIQSYQQAGVSQLAKFIAAKGEVLFGTDVGYMRDYDTTEEFEMMVKAGMTFDGILASLTTNPSRRFGADGDNGKLEAGQPADLVIFASDPRSDPVRLSNVVLTVKNGKVVFSTELVTVQVTTATN